MTEKSNGTNQDENYFAQLKRSLDGTHHHVSHEHLARYLGEFDFRYATCKMSDVERMVVLASQADNRLTAGCRTANWSVCDASSAMRASHKGVTS